MEITKRPGMFSVEYIKLSRDFHQGQVDKYEKSKNREAVKLHLAEVEKCNEILETIRYFKNKLN